MTIRAESLLTEFTAAGVTFYTGVADSLLKALNTEIARREGKGIRHVPAPNEGAAVAMAAGHYLATSEVAVVYLQNSGLGNTVNPLVSLTDRGVYGLPMLMVVGWRGEPERPDEPQHLLQGRITTELLTLMGIPVRHLPDSESDLAGFVTELLADARHEARPVALLVRKGEIVGDPTDAEPEGGTSVRRSDVIERLLDLLPSTTVFVATTGYTGRELAQLRAQRQEDDTRDLLVVGSMGHASSIALGIALGAPSVPVCCIDGDGALAMHTGALAAVAAQAPPNLVHVVVNNGVHESVGGQPTAMGSTDITGLARAAGYSRVDRCVTIDQLGVALAGGVSGPHLVEVVVTPGTLDDLARPDRLGERGARLRESLARG